MLDWRAIDWLGAVPLEKKMKKLLEAEWKVPLKVEYKDPCKAFFLFLFLLVSEEIDSEILLDFLRQMVAFGFGVFLLHSVKWIRFGLGYLAL